MAKTKSLTEIRQASHGLLNDAYVTGVEYGRLTAETRALNALRPIFDALGIRWMNAHDRKGCDGERWFDAAIQEMLDAFREWRDKQYATGLLDGREDGAQVLHEIRGILGFDNDGDDRPHVNTNREGWWEEYKEQRLREAEEFRKDYDEINDGDEIPTGVIALAQEGCERYSDGTNCMRTGVLSWLSRQMRRTCTAGHVVSGRR